MKLILLTILSFIATKHPILMIMSMITMCLLLNVYMYMYMKYTWFIYIITLLILGGLLVIFLYITSLTPNKKFNFNKKVFLLTPLILFLNTPQIMTMDQHYQIMTLFYPKSLTMVILTLIYLLLTLISIMSVVKSSMAPLKSSN
uniref:NADH dehydrogenase subunit 6 n=1 Tax=Alectorobius peruvianus TaxID=879266 RepID=UPI00223827FE|nr:NADH dehydrogenase subunit 6 [Alectorobius peruvianus]UYB78532.1 NADH dehydrogenase subunit 6 [Alectorobius peruvianus]